MPEDQSNKPETPIEGAALRVISNLYDAVADGADYEPMFLAMDEVIDQVLGGPEIEAGAKAVEPLLMPHFDRAAHVFDVMSRQETETPLTFVDRATNATAVLDQTGKIIAVNPSFSENFASVGDCLGNHFATPKDQARFQALVQANAPDSQAIINAVNPKDGSPVSLLAGRAPSIKLPQSGSSALYMMMVKPNWGPKTSDLLRDAYDLNTAEIEILRSFVQTGSVQGVAEQRNRSIRTVRTQLSRIFAQMGITGQTGLALFLATLGGLISETDIAGTPAGDARDGVSEITPKAISFRSKTVEYLEYGDPAGRPVLLLQSSHPPELFATLRAKLHQAGLRIIAPLKPGSGRSVLLSGRPGPDGLAAYYRAVLDAAGVQRAVVAGQASGGLYALEFARQFPDIAEAVCLIDTGVPFRDRSELMELPSPIKRTMVPARYLPNLLYLPHRLVASNFSRSRKGEARVIDYFFNGSPVEQELTRVRRDAYEFTRALIGYSLRDSDRLVDDIARWVSDWSDLLETVTAQKRVMFFHGEGNVFHRPKRIKAWVAARKACELVLAPGGGQLALLLYPDLFVESLLSLVRYPDA